MASGPGPAGRGWFVLVAGWPGSGKSTWFDYAITLARTGSGRLP
jgi:ABC-type lipoprotein export system ATPase subunit